MYLLTDCHSLHQDPSFPGKDGGHTSSHVPPAKLEVRGFLRDVVEGIWPVIHEAGQMVKKGFPGPNTDKYPDIPKKLGFYHTEEILERYPDFTRKQRETKMAKEVHPAILIIGIGYVLEDGYPHEMPAADYDDWISPTIKKNERRFHGLNGEILVWNPVTKRRHELTSMGIRVTKETLVQQVKEAGQEYFLQLSYPQEILNDEIPIGIGGGIGQSRTFMYLLRTAHLGEVSTSVWPDVLKSICKRKNIHILE